MSAEGEVMLSKAIKAQDRCNVLAQRRGEVTLIHDVRPGEETEVAELLAAEALRNCVRLLEGVHSLRLFAIDDGTRLVLCGEFDAPIEDRLAQLCIRCQAQLGELWAHCKGYPGGGIGSVPAFAAFVVAGFQPCGFHYRAFPQTSVRQIRRALDWMRKTVHFQIELAKKPRSS